MTRGSPFMRAKGSRSDARQRRRISRGVVATVIPGTYGAAGSFVVFELRPFCITTKSTSDELRLDGTLNVI